MKTLKKPSFKEKAEIPYDADDVNIRLQHFRVYELVKMINEEALDILDEEDFKLMDAGKETQASLFGDDKEDVDIWGEDDLQRNPGLWNNVQKSQFIESLMIKLPVPLFYFDGSKRPWRVIDGLQRLHTIISFIEGKFKLSGLEYLVKECDGKFFADKTMPGYLRARILNAELIGYVINPGTPPEVKYNIFKRINTGGLKLTGQEIRNAFFKGAPAEFTKSLALTTLFKEVTNNRIPTRRMLDREYVTRFTAFQIYDYKEYNGKMDLFLSMAMSEMNDTRFNFSEIQDAFTLSLDRCFVLLREKSFYRPKPNGEWGRSPNKALFDTMSWNMSQLTDREFSKLEINRDRFVRKYNRFMNEDGEMYSSINDTTGSKKSVINRFTKLNHFLKDFIQ